MTSAFSSGQHGANRLGPGMGLSIARKLAVSMDGDIAAKSALGVGSTFTFTCVLDRPAPRTCVTIRCVLE
jgi:signal transduction histidine kinase